MKNTYLLLLMGMLLLVPSFPAQSQWVHLTGPDGGTIHCLSIYQSHIFMGTDSGVFASSNHGDSWIPSSNGLYHQPIYCLAFSLTSDGIVGSDLFAGSDSGRIFLTIHLGASWTSMYPGMCVFPIRCLATGRASDTSRSPVYAGSWGAGAFRLDSWGGSSTPINSGLDGVTIKSLVVKDTNLYTVSENGVFLSTDRGENWNTINSGFDLEPGSPTRETIAVLGVCNSELFAGAAYNDPSLGGSVHRYQESTMSWMGPILTTGLIRGFASSDSTIIVGSTKGIYLSKDYGTYWLDVTDELQTSQLNCLTICDSIAFVSNETGIWRRPLSEMMTSIKSLATEVPETFHLKQNFPNPFNPKTAIEFSIPSSTHVTLTVNDVRGARIATIIDETLSAGNYRTKWDASANPSGVYFYTLSAGMNIETKKLVVVK